MTIALTPIVDGDLCHGSRWTVANVDILAERVARVALGEYTPRGRNVKVQEGTPPATPKEFAADAKSKLKVADNGDPGVLIISGDSRFDLDTNKFAQLEAHELLNAAGRAGRAGESSQGLVLVVPSKVVAFEETANSIGPHWMKLQSIFSQSDQCLRYRRPFDGAPRSDTRRCAPRNAILLAEPTAGSGSGRR